jgi:hypothetical protein
MQRYGVHCSSDYVLIDFIQLANILPTKSVPQTGRQSQKRKRCRRDTVATEPEEEGSPQQLPASLQSLDEASNAHCEVSSLVGGRSAKASNVGTLTGTHSSSTNDLLGLVCDQESHLLILQVH